MATIKEIAKHTGFSQATVSRILNDDPSFSVKESTRQKVLSASLELGYESVSQYQRIVIPRDIAILNNVVPDKGLQDAYFDELREVLTAQAKGQRMNATIYDNVDDLITHGGEYAGFISMGPEVLPIETLHRLHRALPHGVFIDINPAPNLFDSVQPDLEQIMLDALDALKADGCRRIGFIGGAGTMMGEHLYPEDVRRFAFHNWSTRLELNTEGLIYADGPFTVANGRGQGERLLRDHADNLPDAVIVAADTLAVGLLQAFAAKGILVPRDVKMISINNQEVSKYTSPTLSTYDIDKGELTRAAVLMLAESLVSRRGVRQHTFISSHLVVRDSFIPKRWCCGRGREGKAATPVGRGLPEVLRWADGELRYRLRRSHLLMMRLNRSEEALARANW